MKRSIFLVNLGEAAVLSMYEAQVRAGELIRFEYQLFLLDYFGFPSLKKKILDVRQLILKIISLFSSIIV